MGQEGKKCPKNETKEKYLIPRYFIQYKACLTKFSGYTLLALTILSSDMDEWGRPNEYSLCTGWTMCILADTLQSKSQHSEGQASIARYIPLANMYIRGESYIPRSDKGETLHTVKHLKLSLFLALNPNTSTRLTHLNMGNKTETYVHMWHSHQIKPIPVTSI